MKALFREGPPAHGGQRLVVVHEPAGGPLRGVVVGVGGFAEELNKGRRTAAMGARAMASAGFRVVQLDLLGCGDSSGDLASASWAAWVDDLMDTARWATDGAQAQVPLVLWGMRAGALVASHALGRWHEAAPAGAAPARAAHLLLWQPQPNGKLVLQQFLRLKMAGQLSHAGAGAPAEGDAAAPHGSGAPAVATAAKGVTESLMAELKAGRAVEVAGYPLGPGVALGLAATQLRAPPAGARVLWLEVSSQDSPELLPASQNLVQRWRDSGTDVRPAVVQGPLFWQTLDIEEAPQLVERTAAELPALCELAAGVPA